MGISVKWKGIGLALRQDELAQSRRSGRYSEAHRSRVSDMIDIQKRVADKQGGIRPSLKDWLRKITHNAAPNHCLGA